MSDLPDGWVTISTGDVGIWRGGGTPSKSNRSFWIDGTVPWVSPKDMKRHEISDAIDHITESALAHSSTQLIPDGSVLLVTRSGILQHSLPVAANTVPVAINQDIKAVTPYPGVESDFVLLQLRADSAEILNDCVKQGMTVESIDFEKFKRRPFRLAPLPEQKRIVEKVGVALDRTSRARDELNSVPALVERYRAQLLDMAYAGTLTEGWRRKNNLPDPVYADVGNFAADIRYGTSRKSVDQQIGVPVLRIPNVSSGRINLNDLKYSELSEQEFNKLKLAVGDILIVRSNGSAELVGRPAVVDNQSAGMAYAGYLIRIRPNADVIDSAFFTLMLQAPTIRSVFLASARSTNGIYNVNAKTISALRVPIFQMDEQVEITRRLEIAFEWLSNISSEAGAVEKLLFKLETAILSKAFRGQFLTKYAGDEDVNTLLSQIEAAKSQRVPMPKKRAVKRPTESPAEALTVRDKLIRDSETWPEQGVAFEEVSARVSASHDEFRDALFELLSGTSPVLTQRFDEVKEMILLLRSEQ